MTYETTDLKTPLHIMGLIFGNPDRVGYLAFPLEFRETNDGDWHMWDRNARKGDIISEKFLEILAQRRKKPVHG